MDKTYNPASVEPKWYQRWLDARCFHADASTGGEPYCVVIPPPNVTGILHMGHALNNTIQDILVRWRRMEGRNVVWMPGTDHAGIATQNVVERALRKAGQTRAEVGREAFIDRVWQWREEYGNTIVGQLKRLGASCDWDRERFTMDEGLSDAVADVFVRLFEKGLIYKGNYIVNWCPRCHTALSDEESEHADELGKLYYIRYPVQGGSLKAGDYVVVATTRPETLLGDVAIAVNPNDPRYTELDRQTLLLPVLGRELKVIKDEFVDPEFGTGLVKVTPAHDPNDFEMGTRHGLTPIDVMNGDGSMNAEAGPYAGLDRFDCREQILRQLEAEGLIEKIEDHHHAVGHCYRCDTVVEPRLSPQWFVKMKPLAAPAIEAVTSGKVQFVPQRWEKVYLSWMENIRDWCISRQIWWGHRIPVFYCDACGHVWAAKGKPEVCPVCRQTQIRQDEDVLDTWFSSWLWPFSTFGWPDDNPDLRFYYPTHDLVTASEIIFFWVARMIMAGCEFMGDIPFRTVYIHGTVRDDDGRKMSKSLGNSIDPLSIIEEYSADALRFSLMMITATGQDVYCSNEKFEIGRNFGTKLWNAARYMKMHAERSGVEFACASGDPHPAFDSEVLTADDRHILAKLHEAIRACTGSLERFRFNDAARVLYEFVWHQYCDWYVEYSKDALYGDDVRRRDCVLGVMNYVFSNALRLLHPMMPFVTEELWHELGYGGDGEFIMLAPWPTALDADVLTAWGVDAGVTTYVDSKHDMIRAGRTLRADYDISPAQKVNYRIKPNDEAAECLLQADEASLRSLLRAEQVVIDAGMAIEQAMPSAISAIGTIYMPIEGLVDVAAETERLNGQLEKLRKNMVGVNAKLNNPGFASKAPAHVVERQRDLRADLQEKIDKVERIMATLAALNA